MIEIDNNNEEIPSENKENILLLNNNTHLPPIVNKNSNSRELKNNIEEIK